MPTFEDVTDTEAAVAETSKDDEGGTSSSSSGGITRELIEETVPFLRDPRPEIR